MVRRSSLVYIHLHTDFFLHHCPEVILSLELPIMNCSFAVDLEIVGHTALRHAHDLVYLAEGLQLLILGIIFDVLVYSR